jgi:shikimate dehydrogenase
MDKYTIFGNPINHSLSPKIHKYFAKQTGHLISYEKVLAPRDDFEGHVRDFVISDGRGFNVTVPFKIEAYDLSDKLTTHAKTACSCQYRIKVEDGSYICHITDWDRACC